MLPSVYIAGHLESERFGIEKFGSKVWMMKSCKRVSRELVREHTCKAYQFKQFYQLSIFPLSKVIRFCGRRYQSPLHIELQWIQWISRIDFGHFDLRFRSCQYHWLHRFWLDSGATWFRWLQLHRQSCLLFLSSQTFSLSLSLQPNLIHCYSPPVLLHAESMHSGRTLANLAMLRAN